MPAMGTFQHHQEHAEMPRVTQVPEQICPSSTELQADISKQDISVWATDALFSPIASPRCDSFMVPYINTDQHLLSFPEETWFERGPRGWGCPPGKATCLLSSLLSGHIQIPLWVVPYMAPLLLLQRAILPSLPCALFPGHTKAHRDPLVFLGCDQSSPSRINKQDSRPGRCCCCLCPDEICASSPPASSKTGECKDLFMPFRALLSLHWCFSYVIFLFPSEALQDSVSV